MKHFIAGILFVLICAWGCSANLMLTHMRVDRSIRPSKTGTIAVIASLNYWSGNQGVFSTDDENKTLRMKEAIANLFYNTGLFDDVVYSAGAAKNLIQEKNKKLLFFDIVIFTTEIGSFNWWITWPAVYPMPAYWPIQKKTGTVSVNIEITASDAEHTIGTVNSYGSERYSITFYGFFRTSIIERAAEKAFMDAGSQLKAHLARIQASPTVGKAVSQKILVGLIHDIINENEIIIKHATDQPPRMGELVFADTEERKVKMIVHFPMLTISKCRLIKTSELSELKKNMSVYKN